MKNDSLNSLKLHSLKKSGKKIVLRSQQALHPYDVIK